MDHEVYLNLVNLDKRLAAIEDKLQLNKEEVEVVGKGK